MERTNSLSLLEAECEMVNAFGDYRAYAQDLVMLRTLKSLGFAPRTIYDAGASDGIWSYVANWVFPEAQFELFDPLASETKYINSRAGHRGLQRFFEQSNVRMHEVALGRVAMAEGGLAVFPDMVGSTTLPLDVMPDDVAARTLPLVCLDSYVDAEGLRPPDLIKLDTQGSELDILRGAAGLLPTTTAILCECWLFPGYGKATPLWLEVANFLREHGFEIFDFGWVYRRPADQRSATVDILFVRRSAKISPLYNYRDSR